MQIDALTFDVGEAALEASDPAERRWRSPANVVTIVTLFPQPPEWTFDLTDEAAALSFCEQATTGVVLSGGVTAAAGCEALHCLCKIWPEGWTGRFYMGVVFVPLADALFRINIGANEHGTTGVRESTVTALHLQNPAFPASPDEEFWDATFPQHPLTLVRARLREVLTSLALASAGDPLKPFRVAGVMP